MTLIELLQQPAVQWVMKSGRAPNVVIRSARDRFEFWPERAFLEDQDDGSKTLIIEVRP